MPQLHRDAPALGMHGVGDPPPAGDLLGVVDAGRVEIALTLGADLRRLGDDQPGARALPVVLDGEVRRHLPGRGAVARQRRHDDAVGEVEVADADGVEQGRHGRSLQGEGKQPHQRARANDPSRARSEPEFRRTITRPTLARRFDVHQHGTTSVAPPQRTWGAVGRVQF